MELSLRVEVPATSVLQLFPPAVPRPTCRRGSAQARRQERKRKHLCAPRQVAPGTRPCTCLPAFLRGCAPFAATFNQRHFLVMFLTTFPVHVEERCDALSSWFSERFGRCSLLPKMDDRRSLSRFRTFSYFFSTPEFGLFLSQEHEDKQKHWRRKSP